MRDCPTCGRPTPEARFCVRCGAPMEGSLGHARERSHYAAAPHQHRLTPWPVATLFPHLTHASMRHFRIALGIGAVTVAVLSALRLFPIALITAALLMPVLTALYFYDIDVYEGEPWVPVSFTFAWGLVAGVLTGILAKGVTPSGAALIDKGSSAHTLTGGVLLPLLGFILALAGPLPLLRHRRYDDVLDGATFGASCAAALAATQAIVVGVSVLGGGLRPTGEALPWVLRLLTLGVATPVLAMAAVGSAAASLWLRYRAPVQDRNALGRFGHPFVAVPIAGALVVAGAIGETFMAAGLWLASVTVLALVAFMLLRRALHLGLLEEADQKEVGPPITCANCGAQTATHTFCGNCGIALKALPKTRRTGAEPGQSPGRLGVGGRLIHHRVFLASAAIAIAATIGLIVGVLAAPSRSKPACSRGVQCGAPPILSHAVFAFSGYTGWQSPGLGFTLRYPSSEWQISQKGAGGVQLQTNDGSSVLLVVGAPTTEASPSVLLKSQLSSLGHSLLGLASDSSRSDRLLGTSVGLRPGPGGAYAATLSSPQGPQTPVSIGAMAATDGRVSIVAIVITPSSDTKHKAAVYQSADDIIASVQWSAP